MGKNTQTSNSKIIVGAIVLFIGLYFVIKMLSNFLFDTYFNDFERTIAIIQDRTYGGTVSMTLSYDFHYRVDNTIYRGQYSIPKDGVEKRLKYPKYKYLLIYSKDKPSYYVFVPVEVTERNYKDIKLDRERLKKEFLWPNNKAKVVKVIK
ncbi:hypothetical protein [Saccharicrinis aurantiacus]|uniref:hypothetical protein n=1 Tax=Saccharicrinis aurantiacus TaxID=1849719 RepID=UPI0024902AAD|nr:hypothetical protein [Saccharicrinis aurantiacus]